MNKREKGFTLIELLVSIAIMGILFAIIIAVLSNARKDAQDSKVKIQLSAARSRAEVFYDNHGGSYNGTAGNIYGSCVTPNSMFTDSSSGMSLQVLQDNYPTGATLTCYSTNSAYAISALLPGIGGTNSWCIDSLNNSKARSAPINSPAC